MDRLDYIKRGFDMRTLLTNVIGFAELLADPLVPLSMKSRLEYAKIIHASGLQLEAELAEMLTGAKDLSVSG
jgi:signal transduction histidine kinase